MPMYDYACEACGHQFEVQHGMNEEGPKKCPNPDCKKRKVRRAFTTPPAYHNHLSPMHPRVNRGRGY